MCRFFYHVNYLKVGGKVSLYFYSKIYMLVHYYIGLVISIHASTLLYRTSNIYISKPIYINFISPILSKDNNSISSPYSTVIFQYFRDFLLTLPLKLSNGVANTHLP